MKKILLVLFAALMIACSGFSAFAEEGSDAANDVSTEAVSDVSTEAVSDVSTEAVSDETTEAPSKEESKAPSKEESKPAKEEGAVEDLNIDFQPSRFVDNLSKMGIGMLGIFIVMGVVIIVTSILNKVTSKK